MKYLYLDPSFKGSELARPQGLVEPAEPVGAAVVRGHDDHGVLAQVAPGALHEAADGTLVDTLRVPRGADAAYIVILVEPREQPVSDLGGRSLHRCFPVFEAKMQKQCPHFARPRPRACNGGFRLKRKE